MHLDAVLFYFGRSSVCNRADDGQREMRSLSQGPVSVEPDQAAGVGTLGPFRSLKFRLHSQQ